VSFLLDDETKEEEKIVGKQSRLKVFFFVGEKWMKKADKSPPRFE
jgi:hypothetical protein